MSRVRSIIDGSFVVPGKAAPTYVGEGSVFIWPAAGTGKAFTTGPTHYLVVWMRRKSGKRLVEEYACTCRGFYFSEKDHCKHVEELKAQIDEMKGGKDGKKGAPGVH